MSSKCLFGSDWKRWTEVCWVMFVFDVILDDTNELKIFIWKWLKEVNRSVISNVRFRCDVGWWEWVENICLKVIERGEQKSREWCSFLMWCWMTRMSWKYLFGSDWKRWTEVCWVMFVFDVMLDDTNELKRIPWKTSCVVDRISYVVYFCDVMNYGGRCVGFVCDNVRI